MSRLINMHATTCALVTAEAKFGADLASTVGFLKCSCGAIALVNARPHGKPPGGDDLRCPECALPLGLDRAPYNQF
jgi:hypothetical protein